MLLNCSSALVSNVKVSSIQYFSKCSFALEQKIFDLVLSLIKIKYNSLIFNELRKER